jgi:hypothetical protein
MLSLLASVLGWSDAEREKAGLQKAGLGVGGRSLLGGGSPSRKSSELGKIDETEVNSTPLPTPESYGLIVYGDIVLLSDVG